MGRIIPVYRVLPLVAFVDHSQPTFPRMVIRDMGVRFDQCSTLAAIMRYQEQGKALRSAGIERRSGGSYPMSALQSSATVAICTLSSGRTNG